MMEVSGPDSGEKAVKLMESPVDAVVLNAGGRGGKKNLVYIWIGG